LDDVGSDDNAYSSFARVERVDLKNAATIYGKG